MDRPRWSHGTVGQMDGEAGWWTSGGKIGLIQLARVKGVGKQQQMGFEEAQCACVKDVKQTHEWCIVKRGFTLGVEVCVVNSRW